MVADDYAIQEYVKGTVTNRSGSITGSSDPRPFTGTHPGRCPLHQQARQGSGLSHTGRVGTLRTYRTGPVTTEQLRFGPMVTSLSPCNTTEGTKFPEPGAGFEHHHRQQRPRRWNEPLT